MEFLQILPRKRSAQCCGIFNMRIRGTQEILCVRLSLTGYYTVTSSPPDLKQYEGKEKNEVDTAAGTGI